MQSGWLRASQRALDAPASTALLPVQTHARADVAPLPKGTPTLVRVPLYPFGHEFRAGSRIRIVVQPPGGNRPSWAFAAHTSDRAPSTILRSPSAPSKVVLPVVAGVDVSTGLPACDSLRGQPCRPYVPADTSARSRSSDHGRFRSEAPMTSPVYELADALRRALRRARPARGDGRGHHRPRPRDDRLLPRRRRRTRRARPRHPARRSTTVDVGDEPTGSRPR